MLALTTTQGFWIVEENNKKAWRIDCGKGVYYGLSWSDDYIFVAARQARYGGDRMQQRNIILCFDRYLRFVENISPPSAIRDVHQIIFHGGKLYVISTFDDKIHILDVASRKWDIWAPFEPILPEAQDQHHINSIYVHEDEIWLSGTKPKGGAARFAQKNLVQIEKSYVGNKPHNTWRQDGNQYVLSSDDGKICSTAGDSIAVFPKGWLRGVAYTDKGFWIGASEPADRPQRHKSDLCLLHLVDGKIDFGLTLRKEGMVHDLRSLSVEDRETHNGTKFCLRDDALDGRFQAVDLEDGFGPFST